MTKLETAATVVMLRKRGHTRLAAVSDHRIGGAAGHKRRAAHSGQRTIATAPPIQLAEDRARNSVSREAAKERVPASANISASDDEATKAMSSKASHALPALDADRIDGDEAMTSLPRGGHFEDARSVNLNGRDARHDLLRKRLSTMCSPGQTNSASDVAMQFVPSKAREYVPTDAEPNAGESVGRAIIADKAAILPVPRSHRQPKR